MCYTKIMKLFIRLNNLLNKAVYYIEFNILLLYSTLFVIFYMLSFILYKTVDSFTFLMLYIETCLLDKYITTCGIIFAIFVCNLITLKKHVKYTNKIPYQYKILFKILLVINFIAFIFLSIYNFK